MKGSKEIFMEAGGRGEKWSDNWNELITYPWSGEKEKPAKEIKEKPNAPIAEHDEREWKAAIDKFDF